MGSEFHRSVDFLSRDFGLKDNSSLKEKLSCRSTHPPVKGTVDPHIKLLLLSTMEDILKIIGNY